MKFSWKNIWKKIKESWAPLPDEFFEKLSTDALLRLIKCGDSQTAAQAAHEIKNRVYSGNFK